MGKGINTAAEAAEEEALPKRHGVTCNPDGTVTRDTEEIPESVSKTPVEQKSPAQWAYERIILYIQAFEEQLDNEHEVAMGFTGTDSGVLRIEGMGYFDPDIVTFYGADQNGLKTQSIQHVSQLNVALRALPAYHQREKPNRIGFRLAQDLDERAKNGDSPE